MAITAQIKFTQGVTTDLPGRAVIGSAGVPVNCANGNDLNVVFWEWLLVDVPMSSALAPGVLATGPSASLASFLPDVSGCYRVQVTVRDAAGNIIQDVRDFAVPNAKGWIVPSFKSGSNELNFAGALRGWAALMDTILADLAAGISGDLSGNVAVTATQSTWGDVVSKRWPQVTTTTAASTLLASIPIAPSTGYNMTILVTAKAVASGAYFSKQFSLSVSRNVASAPVLGLNPDIPANPVAGGSAWSCTADLVGNAILVNAVGFAATTIDWEVVTQIKASV
jgi:hypothetical protein